MSKWLDRFRADEDDIANPHKPTGAPLMDAAALRALLDRLDGYYDFQCEGGSLRNCVEWQQLRRIALTSSLRADTPEPPPQDEMLLKAIKLLEALSEPCNNPGNSDDHAWRLCRRCMAIRQFDFAPDVTRILVDRILTALRSREGDRPPEARTPTSCGECYGVGKVLRKQGDEWTTCGACAGTGKHA